MRRRPQLRKLSPLDVRAESTGLTMSSLTRKVRPWSSHHLEADLHPPLAPPGPAKSVCIFSRLQGFVCTGVFEKHWLIINHNIN